MTRLVKGKVASNRLPQISNRDLFVTSVIRSKSGPEGWNIVDSLELLDLFYKDSENYVSLVKLVKSGIKLCLSKQSNPLDYPTYSLRINNSKNIPYSYPISTVIYNNRNNTQEGLGKLILDEDYTLAYTLKLGSKMQSGDFLAIPLLDIENYNTLIYYGDTSPIASEYFRGSHRVEGDDIESQLTSISDYLKSEGYNVSIEGNVLKFWSDVAYQYLGFYKLSDGNLNKDDEKNHDLLVEYSMKDTLIEFKSKIFGSRANNIKISINNIPYTSDYRLDITLDNFQESYVVEFSGGSDHYIEDVLLESLILDCKVIGTIGSLNLSGEYEMRRLQSDLPYSYDTSNLLFKESSTYITDYLKSLYVDVDNHENLTLKELSILTNTEDRLIKESEYFLMALSWVGNDSNYLSKLLPILKSQKYSDYASILMLDESKIGIDLSTNPSIQEVEDSINDPGETQWIDQIMIDTVINLSKELERFDLLHYLMVDDELRNDYYTKWMTEYLGKRYGAYFIAHSDGEMLVEHDRVISFSQSLKDLDGHVMACIPTLIRIYYHEFLGDLDYHEVSGVVLDKGTHVIYDVSPYVIDLIYLINTKGKDVIEDLIIKSFTLRLTKKFEDLIGSDDYYYAIASDKVIETLSLCRMVESASIEECEKIGLNRLRIKVSLKVKQYSTGVIHLNFNINI